MARRVRQASGFGHGTFVSLFALSLGAASVVAQSVWIRELSLLWFGSELCWGITLSAWLLGVAAGAAFAGAASRRIPPAVLATVFALALAVTLGGGLWVLRSARSLLGTPAGEFVPAPQMLALTFAVAGTTGLWVGALFPAGCALAGDAFGSARRTIGIFFLIEALGTLAGGVAFTFWWVERFDPFALLATLSAVVLATAAGACAAPRAGQSRRSPLNLCCALAATVAAGILAGASHRGLTRRLERASQQARWADLFPSAATGHVPRHVAGAESRFGRIDLGELGGQWMLYLNCRPAATFPNRQGIVLPVHLAASQCPRLRRVLVIGSATGELAAELGRYPAAAVEAVELDPQVQRLIAAHALPWQPDKGAEDGRGLTWKAPTEYADGRHYLKSATGRYDLILLAVGDPASITAARFYSREFFREAGRRLTDEGVLAFSLSGPAGKISRQLRDYLGSVYRSLSDVFPATLWTWGDPTYVFAARRAGVLTADPEELIARYARHAGPADFDADYFLGWREDRLQPERLNRLAAALRSTPPERANTDARPIAMFLHLQRAEQALLSLGAGPGGAKRRSLLAILGRVRLGHALWAVAAVAAAVCLATLLRRPGRLRAGETDKVTILFSLTTTGLAAIALEVVLMAAFQNLYGYVYSHIALIVAVYMGGVAVGSLLHSRRRFPSPRRAWRRLVLLDVSLCLGTAAAPWVLTLLGRMPTGAAAMTATEWIVLTMVAGAGLAGGMAVPLAAGLYRARADAHAGRVAGAVDAADCLGGAIGAVACGLVLLPLVGAAAACGVFALLKLASVMALLIGRPGQDRPCQGQPAVV